MNELKDTAIVLRVANYKEKDLILSLLTKDNGRLSICARGVRGGSRRFAGGIDIFDCADIRIHKSARSRNLEHFSRIETWSNLAKNPKLFQIASTCLETLTNLTDEEESDARELFLLLFLTLRALNKSSDLDQQNSILVFFLISILEKTGFGLPNFTNPELLNWANSMQGTPVVPNNKALIKSALAILISHVQELTNKKINSAC